jgi:ABC-type sugar transport system substrate-binding protein
MAAKQAGIPFALWDTIINSTESVDAAFFSFTGDLKLNN